MRLTAVLAMVIALAGSSPLVGVQADAANDEAALVRAAILETITIDPERVESEVLGKVFAAPLYDVTVKIAWTERPKTLRKRFAWKDDGFMALEGDFSTDTPMPNLKSIIRDELRLQSEADAKVFETMLDELFPIDDSSDEAVKAIKRSENTWTFVRGEFLSKYKGFVVEVDGQGAVTDMKYELGIE